MDGCEPSPATTMADLLQTTKTAKRAVDIGLKIVKLQGKKFRLNVDTARLIRTFMMDEYAVDTTMPCWKTMMSSVASSPPL